MTLLQKLPGILFIVMVISMFASIIAATVVDSLYDVKNLNPILTFTIYFVAFIIVFIITVYLIVKIYIVMVNIYPKLENNNDTLDELSKNGKAINEIDQN